MPQAKSVACFVMLAAGSRYETKDTNGIAHFAEHMFFKGTERRPSARDIAGEIDTIGGEFNAFTGKEYTGYYVKCAAEHRDIALDVLVDMLRHSKFEPEEIDREKGVIVEEMNMYYDTPRDYLEGVYDELLYGDQPLGWDIIGTKETVRGGDPRDVPRLPRPLVPRAPHGRGDRGRRGRRRGRAARGAARRRGRRRHRRARRRSSGRRTRPRVKVHSKQSDQAHIRLGVHSYPIDHPDRYALSVLATILGGGMSSRLFSEVRERRGLAYYIYGYNQGYTDAGTLFAQGGVDIARIDEAIETVVAEFARIGREPVSDDELAKAKSFSRGRLVLSLEDPRGTIMFGLRSEVLEGAGPRAGRGARRHRRGHGRGRAARRRRHHPRRPPEPGRDRAVRRRSAVHEAPVALLARAVPRGPAPSWRGPASGTTPRSGPGIQRSTVMPGSRSSHEAASRLSTVCSKHLERRRPGGPRSRRGRRRRGRASERAVDLDDRAGVVRRRRREARRCGVRRRRRSRPARTSIARMKRNVLMPVRRPRAAKVP